MFMHRLILFLAMFLAGVGYSPAGAEQADVNAAARSVVRVVLIGVRNGGAFLIGHGTGLAVDRTHILTNAHVVSDSIEYNNVVLGIIPPEGQKRWLARIAAYAPAQDLALLELEEGGGLEAMTMFTGPVEDGAKVVAIGYPGTVDRAQGLDADDVITPMAPVKSPGALTGGRSAKAFETLLHDAPIGSGNSGGPLVDECGRVLGVNSFGTVGGEIDSEFYFAVAMSEVMRFLLKAGIQPASTGERCRSMEDLEKLASQKEREARERAEAELAKREQARNEAIEQARTAITEERENAMALAALLLAGSVLAGVAAFALSQKEDQRRRAMIAGGVGLACFAGALVVWLLRPSLSEAEDRAGEDDPAIGRSSQGKVRQATGDLVCIIDSANSRITVSATTDVPFHWSEDGCVNNRTQYGRGDQRWERILVPNEDQTVTVASFDPASRVYLTERYLLDLETMEQVRSLRRKLNPPSCGSAPDAASDYGVEQQRLLELLPERPNERLVYNCRPQP